MVMEKVLQVDGLRKSFKDVRAVDGVSFEVRRSELFAFLGENGAGKSTSINIICGILDKDDGSVVVCGHDIDRELGAVKNDLGVVFQNSVLDRKLSAYDNIKYRAGLYGICGGEFKKRLAELDALLGLKPIMKRPVEKLSVGQRRRVDIARALFHRPKILILDEPTTGLDPATRRTVWNVIDGMRRDEGLSVFLTTHYMEEAAEADYVVILDAGKKVAEGTPHELKEKFARDMIRFYGESAAAEEYFARLGNAVKRERGYLQVEVASTEEAAKHIAAAPELFTDFEVVKGNMDSVFLNVTGKELSEAAE